MQKRSCSGGLAPWRGCVCHCCSGQYCCLCYLRGVVIRDEPTQPAPAPQCAHFSHCWREQVQSRDPTGTQSHPPHRGGKGVSGMLGSQLFRIKDAWQGSFSSEPCLWPQPSVVTLRGHPFSSQFCSCSMCLVVEDHLQCLQPAQLHTCN